MAKKQCHVKRTWKTTRATLPAMILLAMPGILKSQQLDNLKGQQPVTLSGFVSTNQVLNSQPADTGNKLTYSGYYTGSLNFNIYGASVPLTFIYSNRQGNFTHPFNQYGMHPSYKWASGHIGYASMNFSPYTLNGHLFLGVGAEIDPPGPFRASAMYGRLKKAVEYDSLNPGQPPAYRRMGYALKVGLAKESGYIDIVLFGASDKAGGIGTLPESLQIMPQENTAFSVSVGKQIAKKLDLKAEYGNSFLTTDSRAVKNGEGRGFLQPATWFMPAKQTSTSRDALKANLTYQETRWSLGLGYERVDPGYATLGAYYFTNNMENMTLNFTANFLENKINISGNGGVQRDNLDKGKLNNTRRHVGSGTINVVPNEKLNATLSYSNFQSYTNARSTFDYINQSGPYENWDTLNYRQISQNINLNTSYQLGGNEKRRQSVATALTWQSSDDNGQADSTGAGTRFYNANASYVIAFVPSSFNISTSVNYNRNEVPETMSTTWGPSVTLSKQFFDKTLRATLTCSYNTSTTGGENTGEIYNIRLGCGHAIKKKHKLNLGALYQIRHTARRRETYTATFGYSYNFNIIKPKGQQGQTGSPTP